MMGRFRIAGLLVIGAMIAAAGVAFTFGLPASFLADALRARVEAETGYRLAIAGPVRIALRPGLTLFADAVTLSDPATAGARAPFSAARIAGHLSLAGLLQGKPRIDTLTLTRPVLQVSAPRADRARPASPGGPSVPARQSAEIPAALARLVVEDGTLVLYDEAVRSESRFTGIEVDAMLPSAVQALDMKARGNVGRQAIMLRAQSTAPAGDLAGGFPVTFTLDAPGLIDAPLAARAQVTLSRTALGIAGLRGDIGGNAVSGALAADFSTATPHLRGELSFQRLLIAAGPPPASADHIAASGAQAPADEWSDREIDLEPLHYFDADVTLTAGEFVFHKLRLAPLSLKATLAGGLLRVSLAQTALYGGRMTATFVTDAAQKIPAHAARLDLDGVSALPLFSDLADFDAFDGRLRGKLDLTATGQSPRALVASLSGTADLKLSDGEIRGLNVADMMRSLMSQVLTGWQAGERKKTDFNEFSATFQLKDGQATTLDLNLAGPLVRMRGTGIVDLLTRQLSFRLDPKVVASLEGQGGPSDPLGLGVPVIVQGPWREPQIYPDIAGIADDPAAAFEKLRTLGAGLFGLFGGDQKNGRKSGEPDIIKSIGDMLGGSKAGDKSDAGTGTGGKTAAPGNAAPGRPAPNAQDDDMATTILRGLFGK
jgi:AsmA protein